MNQKEIIKLIAQILGIIAVLLGFLSYQVKTAKKLLVINGATCLVFCIHYLLLGAYPAFALNTVGIFRNLAYNNKDKKIFSSKIIPYLFAAIMLVLGLLSWTGWYSIFVVLGLVINTLCLSFTNPQNIRKSILVSSPLVLVYNAFVHSVGGFIYEAVVIVSSIIGIIRFRKGKKQEEKQ